MHSTKLWLSSVLSLAFSLAIAMTPAWALPVPKLPPEAVDKPGVSVRVRPLGELLLDAKYIAKLVGQAEIFEAVEPGVAPMLESIDQKKPIGFYAKIAANPTDSYGVLMVPVKDLKAFIGMLNTLGVNPAEGDKGLYTVNAPGSPFPILFRHVNGYLYGTVRNTPDAESALAANKLLAPQVVFKDGDDGLFSVTFNTDAIPNDLKKKALDILEQGVTEFRLKELPKADNPAAKAMMETASEEIGIKLQALIVDTLAVTFRLDLDRAKETVGVNGKMTARPGSVLEADVKALADRQGLGIGLLGKGSVAHASVNIAIPATLKKTLEPVIDDFIAKGWKKAEGKAQPYAKELLEILGPTLKAGVLDLGFDLRGPDRDDRYAGVMALKVDGADKIEPLFRKALAEAPADSKGKVKLDVSKIGDVKINQITPGRGGQNVDDLFGEDPAVLTGFRKDAILVGIGPNAEAMTAIKSAVEVTPKSSAVMQGQISIRRMAAFMDRKEAGTAGAIRKAFPDTVDDTARFSLSGGSSLDFRMSMSARVIQFGQLMEQIRRGRN